MSCLKKCENNNLGQTGTNNYNYAFLVIVLYILLAIIIGGSLLY